jgi:hypothetical protein
VVCRGKTSLKLDHDATDNGKMRGDERELEPLRNGAGSVGDLSFAVFSLTHAGCREEGAIELRLNERVLLGWCPSCAACRPSDPPTDHPRKMRGWPRRKTVDRRTPMARRAGNRRQKTS